MFVIYLNEDTKRVAVCEEKINEDFFEAEVEQDWKGDWYIKGYVPEQPIEELKAIKIKEAGALFAQKRDVIRQVTLSDGNTYGFDTANEDITNFMASWKAAEISGSTMYKVWLTNDSKGMIIMQLADFKTVFNAVRTSQLEAYAWYGAVNVQIQAATTKEELENIVLE